MSDIDKIVYGALGGVFVTVVGQILSNFFIEPVYALRVAIGEVQNNLSFHGTTIHTPSSRAKESSDAAYDSLRKCACDLEAKFFALPFNSIRWFCVLGVSSSRKDIEAAVVKLHGLSTYVYETGDQANNSLDDIQARVSKIKSLLGIKLLKEL